MPKVILFARVSSSQQDFNRQVSDLMPLIKKDGYDVSQVAVIKHKESATKNNVQNRKSIQELKQLIENEPIEAVYVTEASRLARRGDVMYAVLALLEEKRISLVIQQPTLLRTFENGKSNPIAHVVLSFLAQVAQAESELKLERQKSGYAQKVREGKVVSAKVRFGYVRDKEGYARIDDAKAKVVIDVFESYLAGKSVGSIWEDYRHTGVFGRKSDRSGWVFLSTMLRDRTYIGESPHYAYPPIVDRGLFDKVQERLDTVLMNKTKLKFVYYCRGILRFDGHAMTPNASHATYKYKDWDSLKSYGLNINVIDSTAFTLACEAKAQMNRKSEVERIKGLRKQLEMTLSKIDGIKTDIESNSAEDERLNMLFTKGRITESKYDFEAERIEGEAKHLLDEQERLEVLRLQLENAIETDGNQHMRPAHDFNALMAIEDDQTKAQIVKEAIETINAEKIGTGHYRLTFNYVDKSLNDDSWLEYIQKGGTIRLFHHFDDAVEDWTGTWTNRIERLQRRKANA